MPHFVHVLLEQYINLALPSFALQYCFKAVVLFVELRRVGENYMENTKPQHTIE